MKILFITDGIYPFVLGGMQKHSNYVLKNLAASGNDITIVHTAGKEISGGEVAEKLFGGNMPENIQIVFIPLPRVPKFPGHYIAKSWIFSKSIAKWCIPRMQEFDLIYAKGFTPWYLLKKRNVPFPPVVTQLHGLEMFQRSFSLRAWFEKKLLRIPAISVINNTDYIFSYGGEIRDILIQLGKKKELIFEQYGAADDFWLLPKPAEIAVSRRFVFVARFEFRKGYHVLKKAIQRLISANIPFEIDLVGDIPANEQIQHPNLHYHGNLDAAHIKMLFDNAAFVLLPSLAEGFPTILAEAMARGLLPIASNVGAVSAIVNDANGWLMEPGKADLLIEAMQSALVLEEKLLALKRLEAVKVVEAKFNWKYTQVSLVSQLLSIQNDHRKRSSRQ